MKISKIRLFINSFLRQKVLVNIGTLFTGTAVARVLSALGLMLIARQLGPSGFGQFAAVLTLSKLTSVLFSWGLDTWLLRNGRSSNNSLPEITSVCLKLKIGLGLVWLIAIIFISFFLDQDVFPQSLLILSALSVWFEELAFTGWNAFKAALLNNITSWLMIGSQGLFFIVTVSLISLEIQNAQTYMTVRLVAALVSSIVTIFFVIRVIGLHFPKLSLAFVLRDTIPFGISEGLAIIYGQIDIIIIGYWLGKTAVGFYAPAVALMSTLFMIPRAIYEVMLPITSELYIKHPQSLAQHAYKIVLISSGLGIVMGIGMTIIARPLVWLVYGPTYAVSGHILTLLSPILVLKSLSFGLATVLTAVGWQNRRVIVQLLAALLNIGLNIYIINTYEIIGVAYVYIFTETILVMGYMFYLLYWQHLHRVQLANGLKG